MARNILMWRWENKTDQKPDVVFKLESKAAGKHRVMIRRLFFRETTLNESMLVLTDAVTLLESLPSVCTVTSSMMLLL